MSPLLSAPPAWPAIDDLPARRTLRRSAWRLLPFLGLLYIVAYLDRINIGWHSDRAGSGAFGRGRSLYHRHLCPLFNPQEPT